MQETQALSLGQEGPLEEEMAAHSSVLAWEIPWTEEPGGLQSMGSQRVRHDSATEQRKEERWKRVLLPVAFSITNPQQFIDHHKQK